MIQKQWPGEHLFFCANRRELSNVDRAFELLKRSNDAGEPNSKYSLAYLLTTGVEGVHMDWKQVALLYL